MRAPLLLVVVYFTVLAVTFVALSGGAARAQGSADVSLEQQIQAALANAGFDPGPADGTFGPKTRRAIRAWQRANGHAETGYLTRDQLRSILKHATPTVTLEPKCAELPGQYLGKNHAECWEEVENQPGCFLWNSHYHSDRTTKWNGQCRSGVAEGRGTYSVSAGSEHSSYEGTGMLVTGKADGRWVEKEADGTRTRYEGEYRDDKKHGQGTYTWADGTRYEGEYRDDKKHGQGTYTWADGTRYEGEYRDDKKHGQGTHTWADGRRYQGEYRDGKPHGQGTYTLPDGRRYQGQWHAGCFGERNGGWAAVNTTPAACGFE